ncbi:hypothetical protein OSB04_012439 [Centaurea solstitialis]|uniref:Uncharacterized protein n=1 Tax=Centaurea solstitialis TaxID=347529 RepID=A0AA38WMF7_9ASTR|nr:hypothetical protein OSB04_012439 [Centaurea solstitialis]
MHWKQLKPMGFGFENYNDSHLQTISKYVGKYQDFKSKLFFKTNTEAKSLNLDPKSRKRQMGLLLNDISNLIDAKVLFLIPGEHDTYSLLIKICVHVYVWLQIELKTAPGDYRFPTTNQSRHCFTRYIEFHRCRECFLSIVEKIVEVKHDMLSAYICVAVKGDGAEECKKFAKYYRSLCPAEWVSHRFILLFTVKPCRQVERAEGERSFSGSFVM